MHARILSRTLRTSLCLILITSAFVIAPAQASAAYPTFRFSGSGWGHGIGLSQYGAKGWAEHGKTGEWIAAYYYPETFIGPANDPNRTRDVNIDKGKTSANGGFARASWVIRPGYTSSTLVVSVGGVTKSTLSAANGPYTVSAASGLVKITNKSGTSIGSWAGTVVLTPTGGSSPQLTRVDSASGPFSLTNVRYRGTLRFSVSGSNVKCVNRLPMQEYLYGVVPRESPASWHMEALKAQAIVARSYSIVASSELYCTTSSQVYNGHSRINSAGSVEMHESDRSNEAVNETYNEFVRYGNKVIQTYFHSSSGGYTANIEDVWLGTGEPSTTYPYRRGVSDPYCDGPNDPWPSSPIFDGMTVAAKLAPKIAGEPSGAGTSVYVTALSLSRVYPSQFVKRVDVYWSNGAVSKGVAGDTLRSALGLKSTKFFLGGPYTRIYAADRYTTAQQISQATYPATGSATVAVLANGADDKFADALAAAALGGSAGGPVLLVRGNGITTSTSSELKRLAPSRVYVVGGTASVSDAVLAQAAAAAGITLSAVIRMGGANRYEVAANVALEMRDRGYAQDPGKVIVASGEKWADSAVAAVAAAIARRPLVLVAEARMPRETATALSSLGATQSVVYGGPASISETTLESLLEITGEAAPYKRFGTVGTRYDVAAQSADWCVTELGATVSTAYVASGETFPDSVTGGALAAKTKHPLLLTARYAASLPTCRFLAGNRDAIDTLTILGGPGSVSDETAGLLGESAF
jgi:stage II sporulation protein D